jgi:F0F1-type ATP synthase membrane subunit b/b'
MRFLKKMERVKKDFETLAEEAIDNIRADRDQTKELLKDLVKYLSSDEHRHKEVGLIAAKYVETLQRSNEQLVKIATLQKKGEKASMDLSQTERDEIFEQLNKEVSHMSKKTKKILNGDYSIYSPKMLKSSRMNF